MTGSALTELPVRIDVAEVARVLANLLVNAVRHTPDHGTVSVSGHRDGASARISVSDGCGGIPLTDLARIFDVGFRATASRAPDAGGGLGLTIARGIVEAHHGQIEVANHNGGCRFTVVLPLAEPAGRPPSEEPGQSRSTAAANWPIPASNDTPARQPSSRSARADDAVTCRTSPSR